MRPALQDNVAVVTGSSSGIGRHIARHFAKEGARITVVGRDKARVQATVDEIKEALVQITVYCGTPAGRQAFLAAHDALKPSKE